MSSAPPKDDNARRHAAPARLVAFTDGVFAIVITILVLELKVPSRISGQALSDVLHALEPTFWAWIISFLVTGMYWVVHRGLFSNVRYINSDVVWLNLLFLLPVSLIPFAASTLGKYLLDPTALRLYASVLAAASVLKMLLFAYLDRSPWMWWTAPSGRARRLQLALGIAPLILYGLAALLAGAVPVLSLVLVALVPIGYFAGYAALRRARRTADAVEQVA